MDLLYKVVALPENMRPDKRGLYEFHWKHIEVFLMIGVPFIYVNGLNRLGEQTTEDEPFSVGNLHL